MHILYSLKIRPHQLFKLDSIIIIKNLYFNQRFKLLQEIVKMKIKNK